MRFTDEQWGLMCDMSHALQQMEGSQSDGSESMDGCDSDVDGYGGSSQSETRRLQNQTELDRIMSTFVMTSIKTKVGGAMYTNALLCFLAATTIRQGGDGFQSAGAFTATVAAMLRTKYVT